jgi:hypothetical protein
MGSGRAAIFGGSWEPSMVNEGKRSEAMAERRYGVPRADEHRRRRSRAKTSSSATIDHAAPSRLVGGCGPKQDHPGGHPQLWRITSCTGKHRERVGS